MVSAAGTLHRMARGPGRAAYFPALGRSAVRAVPSGGTRQREPVAAVRKKLQKDGILSRIAYQIRSNKTMNFLFEHARKEAGEPEPPQEAAAE